MARLRKPAVPLIAEDATIRLRAAWLYYDRKMTQREIAEELGVGRTTVTRLLDEALKRAEVQVWINEGGRERTDLALELERRFQLDEAIVVPHAPSEADAARSVGLALGKFLSEGLLDGQSIGVGWGRTLTASLASLRPATNARSRVVSLCGGVIEAPDDNPTDFSWRLASRLGASCLLYPAPLLVDSPATRRALRERCGLDRAERIAGSLDVALFSVGEVGTASTALSRAVLPASIYAELVAAGGTCDLMCNILDAEGRTLDHPVMDCVMSVDLEALARAGHVVIATGGPGRAPAIRAAIRRVGCHTLVTDEGAALALLQAD
ncbi:sugar-binding transcriptional regulator [Aureimonas jatrophae]|uniref:DNA-binding transcriptional regulator LsrR, DeoR family n=1 Tax=Aureimonas jatrophae TaxID=1166073 RepID=A0A1H0FKZ4_9HYPH|nr:sugar-binding domain-containing protein [Aureimonas jatrophae]MBB3949966.1 DNA-binding transcriptional regulator LsrR (DeoR family) [Aureimonas jatrophae]SDN95333.1 DNA-binding transcriptional regulator LsrR, DeoR family [Aureimonas jatrophae]